MICIFVRCKVCICCGLTARFGCWHKPYKRICDAYLSASPRLLKSETETKHWVRCMRCGCVRCGGDASARRQSKLSQRSYQHSAHHTNTHAHTQSEDRSWPKSIARSSKSPANINRIMSGVFVYMYVHKARESDKNLFVMLSWTSFLCECLCVFRQRQ